MSAAPPACPFCDSHEVELVSAWGGQLITSQLRCCRCATYFEAVRDDFERSDLPWRERAGDGGAT